MSTATHVNRPVAIAGTSSLAGTFTNVLVLSFLAIVALSAYVLIHLGGWEYYTTPAAVKGYSPAHALLRPAGRAGHLFGVGGFVLMLVPIVYSIRKKARRFRDAGHLKIWLDVHVFCGIFGPALVTYHTAFKFGGVVSVAYWSMVAVVLSGFVGRYLYARMPRSIRGLELTQNELDGRAREIGEALAAANLPEATLAAIEDFEHRVTPPGRVSYFSLFFGDIRMRREIKRFVRASDGPGASSALTHEIVEVATERATLVRRMAYLQKTKKLFDLWHVFHMPLVYIMFAILVVHVAVTMYMGYVPFMD